jgi:tetratricopeptide (TPR) repeat protein
MMKQGNVEGGVQHFLRAAAINPSDPLSNLNVGFYDYQHRDLRGAAEHYQAVINARSSGVMKVKALNNLGLVYHESGDPVRAQQCFRDARELSRKYSR